MGWVLAVLGVVFVAGLTIVPFAEMSTKLVRT
jgi:hypothetical protein